MAGLNSYHLQEVKPFNIHHDRGLSGLVRCVQISRRRRVAQSMVRHYLIHPGKALEMVLVVMRGTQESC